MCPCPSVSIFFIPHFSPIFFPLRGNYLLIYAKTSASLVRIGHQQANFAFLLFPLIGLTSSSKLQAVFMYTTIDVGRDYVHND